MSQRKKANMKAYRRRKNRTAGAGGGPGSISSALSNQQTLQRNSMAILRMPKYTIARLPGIGMPDELQCTLQYAAQHTFTSTTGSSSLQDFRGSDCYDPDASGTGTQPAWFDALMTIYKYGYVRGSRLVANAKGLTSTVPGTLIVAPINDQAELDASLLTNPCAAEAMITLNQPMFTFDMQMTTHEMYGMRTEETSRASVNHWFTASSSPVYNWYWRLAFRASDGTSTSVVYVDTRIYYNVVFFRRNVSDEDFEREAKRTSKLAAASINSTGSETDAKSLSSTTTTRTSAGASDWALAEEGLDEADYQQFLKWKEATVNLKPKPVVLKPP